MPARLRTAAEPFWSAVARALRATATPLWLTAERPRCAPRTGKAASPGRWRVPLPPQSKERLPALGPHPPPPGTGGAAAESTRVRPPRVCEVRRIRAEALPKIKGGLRALYRTLELPGRNPLKDAHAVLDAAVLEAYGFDPKADLLALNLDVAARIAAGQPVTASGLPPGFPDPGRLVTLDCIQPPSLDGRP